MQRSLNLIMAMATVFFWTLVAFGLYQSNLRLDGYPYPPGPVDATTTNTTGETTLAGTPQVPRPPALSLRGVPEYPPTLPGGGGGTPPLDPPTDPVNTTNLVVFMPFDSDAAINTIDSSQLIAYGGHGNPQYTYDAIIRTNTHVSTNGTRTSSYVVNGTLLNTSKDGEYQTTGYTGLGADLSSSSFNGVITTMTAIAWAYQRPGWDRAHDAAPFAILGDQNNDFMWFGMAGNLRYYFNWVDAIGANFSGNLCDSYGILDPAIYNNRWVMMAVTLDTTGGNSTGEMYIMEAVSNEVTYIVSVEGADAPYDLSAPGLTPMFRPGGGRAGYGATPVSVIFAGQNSHPGPIDNARLYDRVLSSNEIVAIFNADVAGGVTNNVYGSTAWDTATLYSEPLLRYSFTDGSLESTGVFTNNQTLVAYGTPSLTGGIWSNTATSGLYQPKATRDPLPLWLAYDNGHGWTWSFWARMDLAVASQIQMIWQDGDWNGGNAYRSNRLYVYSTAGQMSFQNSRNNTGAWNTMFSFTSDLTTTNGWHHYVIETRMTGAFSIPVSWNGQGSTIRVWEDGVMAAEYTPLNSSSAGPSTYYVQDLAFGFYDQGADFTRGINASFDDIRLYNRVNWTTNEVTAIMAEEDPR